MQVNVEAMPDGPENPYGNGFIAVETDLTSEAKAQRVCDPSKGRMWKVKNPESLNPITGDLSAPSLPRDPQPHVVGATETQLHWTLSFVSLTVPVAIARLHVSD